MKYPFSFRYVPYFAIALFLAGLSACQNNAGPLSIETEKAVTDSALQLMADVSKDISDKGPIAWLTYFEDSPGFFMASGGQLQFTDHAAAVRYVKDTLVKNITRINLHWQHIRVDAVSSTAAATGAGFHEDLSLADGKTIPVDGYFTALAHFDGKAWRLRNLHWSTKEQSAAGH
jgi:hypothetical protein